MRWLLVVAVIVGWLFECCVRDVLERSTDGVTWVDVPGPYEVTDGEYRVTTPGPGLFRVRRWWGEPWTLEPLCTATNCSTSNLEMTLDR